MSSTPVHRFRMAMAKHLGKPLTPEMAAMIEAEAFHLPDCAVSPGRFPAVTFGAYAIQVESFRAILEELAPLHEEHWRETEKYRHGLRMRPDYDRVFAMERAGRCVQFTVRRGAELAGHLRMYLGQSLHTSSTVAEEDTLYLRAAHRPNGFLMLALLRYAEDVLRQLGVTQITANSKKVNNAAVLMRRMRYDEVATQFVKILKEPPDVR
ncbi:MAG: hypothetical protein JWQ03_593 [Variovorax sp.]|nr:hypothetical protein [Variovorax sp.]